MQFSSSSVFKRNSLASTSKKTSFVESERKSFHHPQAKMQQMLNVDVDRLLFYYSNGHTHNLYNRDLKLKNESSLHQIWFKIKSNNPTHYKVRPHEAVIDPGKTLEITIQLLIDYDDLQAQINQSKYFSKFASDKFLLESYPVKRREGRLIQLQNEDKKTIRVQIEIQKKENELVQKSSKRDSIILSQTAFITSLAHQKLELQALQKQISQAQSQNVDSTFLSCSSLFVIFILAFAFGIFISA